MDQAAVGTLADGETRPGLVTPGVAATFRPVGRRPAPAADRAYLAWTVIVDAACFVVAWGLATSVSGASTLAPVSSAGAATVLVLVVLGGLLALRATRLYEPAVIVDGLSQAPALLKAGAVHVVVCLAAADLLGLGLRVPWLVVASAAAVLLLGGFRALGRRSVAALRTRAGLARRVLLVGTDPAALAFHRTVLDHPEAGLLVVAVVGPRAPDLEFGAGVAWAGGGAGDARRAIDAFAIDTVFVVPSALEGAELTRLRRAMAEVHVPVHVVHGFDTVAGSRLRQTRIGTGYLTHVEVDPVCRLSRAVKRGVDIGLGAIVTVLSLPVLAAVALAILVLDGRPVFFRQTRIGRDLHPFQLLKFRTMAPDAESRLAEVASLNEREGPLFKLADDPRVTRIGRLLRATSLDELPQLLNVLAGHMSLVGPRPAMPSEVARFGEELRSRHRMQPGVTGLWQVRSRDENSFDSYESLDLYYVENWSLALDLSILACTGPAVVARAVAELRRPRAKDRHPLAVSEHALAPLRSETA